MSRIYFHGRDAEAEVRGSERAYIGSLCNSLLKVAIGPVFDSPRQPSWVRKILPSDCYVLQVGDFANALDTYLGAGFGDLLIAGERKSVFDLALNTAMRMGNDTIKLMARLHAQCEIHCFVEAPNFEWLATVIENGRQQNILRADMGWENVITLLRSGDPGPVVCSYSVTEEFPNAYVAEQGGTWQPPKDLDYPEEDNWDAWYDLDSDERWQLAVAGLRALPGKLEMSPTDWDGYYFGDGMTGFDLYRIVASS